MAIKLPTEPVKATRVNPKILVLYGPPKVGKTEQLSQLESNLICDLEDGAAYYDSLRIDIRKTSDLDELYDEIMKIGTERAKAGMRGEALFPYKYISLDTVDALEELCERSATANYKKSVIGKSFEGDSVLELPQGGGYYYLRKEVLEKLMKISKVCKTLIVISHIKDKNLMKGGSEVTVKDISLTGKLGSMVCAKADAIGRMFRDSDGELMVSFETIDESVVMGGRCKHLAGITMKFDWNSIFISEEVLSA